VYGGRGRTEGRDKSFCILRNLYIRRATAGSQGGFGDSAVSGRDFFRNRLRTAVHCARLRRTCI